MQKNGAITWRDPAVAALIEKKKVLNKRISTFINDVIHFKKMMNGWPSKFHEEKGKITQPIPQEASTVISKMMSDYQEIGSDSKKIIGEQYSLFLSRLKRRNQKSQSKPQVTPSVAPAAPETNLSEQINAGSDYYLISEASNPLTRFFSQLLSPGIGLDSESARIRKYRVSLLNTAADLYNSLKKLQLEIVKSGPQSILLSSNLLNKVESDYIFINSGLQSFKDILPEGIDDAGGNIPPPKNIGEKSHKSKSQADAVKDQHEAKIIQEVIDIITDVQSVINSPDFPATAGLQQIIILAKAFRAANQENKLKIADELFIVYRDEIAKTCAQHLIPPQNSFRDIQTYLVKNMSGSAHDKLQAVAQNILGKWKHQISPFDKTSAFRLDIYKLAGEARVEIDKIMNYLEEGLNTEALEPHISKAGGLLRLINSKMHTLKAATRGVGYQPQFMNQLQSGQLSDYDIKLNPKEKTKLETRLENERLREIDKMRGK